MAGFRHDGGQDNAGITSEFDGRMFTDAFRALGDKAADYGSLR